MNIQNQTQTKEISFAAKHNMWLSYLFTNLLPFPIGPILLNTYFSFGASVLLDNRGVSISITLS